tara:strand:- start:493 stop:1749 length:1257 start_codon:yes stop_codon:yes gene_type:complete
MNFIKKYTNFNFLISLIIPFLIWGPFFPDLIISCSALFFLYYSFKNNNFYYLKNSPFIIFLIFCIIAILCSLRATDIPLSLESSLFYFRIGIFSCFIWYLIDRDRSILKYFYYALIICFSTLVVDGYFQFFMGKNIFALPSYEARISSFFGDELIMGSYLSRLFPLFFALFLLKEKNKYEIYYIGVLFILIDVLIYISGERTAFFFLNLSTLFIIILIKEYQKFRLITFLLALVIIGSLSFNSEELSNRMIKGPAESMGLLKESQSKNIFTPNHDSLIKTAFNMFLDKPILGHGPKSFRLICKEENYKVGINPCSTHPHNFYIQLLAETGIVGFSFLLISFFYVLYCFYRQLKSIFFKQKRYLSDYQVCLLAGILISVWPFSPNGNFFHNWLIIVYSLPVGFYLQSIYSKKKLTKKNI